MAKAKTDSERQFEAAKSRLEEAQKAVSAAERITTGHPSKIETKRRALANLENTMHHADVDQNSRANRSSKVSALRGDLAKLEHELNEANSALTSARSEEQTARQDESQSAAAFSVEADRARLDAETQRTELAVRSNELAERKFAQSEKAAADAAQTTLEKAKLDGQSAKEVARYEAQAKAANLKFEYQQRREMQQFEAANRQHEIATTSQGNLDLARLQGELAERASILNHGQALEIIKANEIADVGRIMANGKEHRLNVTHETNEDIRKAVALMELATQKGVTDTLNAMKLLIVKSYLRRAEMTHGLEIAKEARAEELDSVAADMAEVAKWNASQRGRPGANKGPA